MFEYEYLAVKMRDILQKYDMKESEIPFSHEYWKIKNQHMYIMKNFPEKVHDGNS